MPSDTFRMLICGPSKSGKTNILLHMLYKLLIYDKMYLCSKNLHQDKYQHPLEDFNSRIDPAVVYEVIEASPIIIPLVALPEDNQKITMFDDMVCESIQKLDYRLFYLRSPPELQRYLPFPVLLQGSQKHSP